MAKHHLGAFSLFPKSRAKRRVKGLLSKLDRAKSQVCALEKRVVDEKRAAADIFTKSDYEALINPLETRMKQTCACADKALEKVEGSAYSEKDVAFVKPRKCRDKINDELEKKFPDVFKKLTKKQKQELMVRGQEGTRSSKQNKAVADCQEGKKVDYDELLSEIKEAASKEGISLSGRSRRRR